MTTTNAWASPRAEHSLNIDEYLRIIGAQNYKTKMTTDISANGWTAVPVDAGAIFGSKPYINTPDAVAVSDVHFPIEDAVVAEVDTFVKARLPRQTYNHSLRVFYFCTIIARQQFPEHSSKLSPSTLALTCLLHDIGTVEEFIAASRMSFEFHGAFQALKLLARLGAAQDQADAVAETIIRHQDLGVDGTITFLGQLIQLGAIYDNVGAHPRVEGFADILHAEVRRAVNEAFPREGWLGCFVATIREEKKLKPWCHSTHIVDFEAMVEGNTLMKEYE
ncbi:hypothetical protein H072_7089 [Dactylellina haptotyla CBS 200.50]|uniref:HD domain-containing protein n=1 Tax=Dactylellina haptotyla (strain CBS 200.50) TaxID=1284197 RepID=S8ADF6_DACHA|nr:hypothetical protein H072_7089 [Dactylellina haptotyla CBS 200.50]